MDQQKWKVIPGLKALIGMLWTKSWYELLLFQIKLTILMPKYQMMNGMMKRIKWKKLLNYYLILKLKKCLTDTILIEVMKFQVWYKNDENKLNDRIQHEQLFWSTQVYFNHQIKQKLRRQITHLIIQENQVNWMIRCYLQQNLNLLQHDKLSKDLHFNSKRMKTRLHLQPQFTTTNEDLQANCLNEIN